MTTNRVSVCPSTLKDTRPKGDGIELRPFLCDGDVEYPGKIWFEEGLGASPLGEAGVWSGLMLVGQRLGCQRSELSFVHCNGRGDERSPIGKVLLDTL